MPPVTQRDVQYDEDGAHSSGDIGTLVVGVRNDSAATTLTSANGDYSPIGVTRTGAVHAAIGGASAIGDGVTAIGVQDAADAGNRVIGVAALTTNGTTWDRQRGNVVDTALVSAERTATTTSADLVNYNGRGVLVAINVTAVTDSPSITVTIQGKETIGNTYRDILTSAAITGTGQTWLRVYPGMAAVANLTANDLVGRNWRVAVTHANSDAITYSIQAITQL